MTRKASIIHADVDESGLDAILSGLDGSWMGCHHGDAGPASGRIRRALMRR